LTYYVFQYKIIFLSQVNMCSKGTS